jgi:hypothetical protein
MSAPVAHPNRWSSVAPSGDEAKFCWESIKLARPTDKTGTVVSRLYVRRFRRRRVSRTRPRSGSAETVAFCLIPRKSPGLAGIWADCSALRKGARYNNKTVQTLMYRLAGRNAGVALDTRQKLAGVHARYTHYELN